MTCLYLNNDHTEGICKSHVSNCIQAIPQLLLASHVHSNNDPCKACLATVSSFYVQYKAFPCNNNNNVSDSQMIVIGSFFFLAFLLTNLKLKHILLY